MNRVDDKKLAKTVVNYSVKLKPKENLLLHVFDKALSLAEEIIKEAQKIGANVFVEYEFESIKRQWLMNPTKEQFSIWYELELNKMKKMDAYVAIRRKENLGELFDVPSKNIKAFHEFYGKLHLEQRVPKTKWCVLIYPSNAFAQKAGMSLAGFERYYNDICTLDYKLFKKFMKPLKDSMDNAKNVRIIGEKTDISFSVDGIKSSICDGTNNIPDGEVCMPIKQGTANGIISYNVPSDFQGYIFEDVVLEFENGRIVKAKANDTTRIDEILDTDKGARSIGEFAIGTNPFVEKVIYQTLFDEKMYGSIHFTPGAGGENKSSIHWDLILSQTPEFGGGEIWFDNKLIRKDGEFLIDELVHLNKDKLVKALRGRKND